MALLLLRVLKGRYCSQSESSKIIVEVTIRIQTMKLRVSWVRSVGTEQELSLGKSIWCRSSWPRSNISTSSSNSIPRLKLHNSQARKLQLLILTRLSFTIYSSTQLSLAPKNLRLSLRVTWRQELMLPFRVKFYYRHQPRDKKIRTVIRTTIWLTLKKALKPPMLLFRMVLEA